MLEISIIKIVKQSMVTFVWC